MHPCFTIDEIVENILENLDQSTLCSLALVNRALLEPAKAKLWRDLPSLVPLLKCLPDYLVGPSQAYQGALTILEPPLAADWQRLSYHAQFVRSLEIPNTNQAGDEDIVDGNAFALLAMHHPGPILPQLRTLKWQDSRLANHALLFIQPTLITLTYASTEVDETRTLMDRVASSAPHLEELKFVPYISRILMDLAVELSRTLTSLPNLTTLDADFSLLSFDTLVHLSRRSRLCSLVVRIGANSQSPWQSPAWGGFPALETISFIPSRGPHSYRTTGSLARSLRGSHLTSVSFFLEQPAHVAEFRDLTDTLSHLVHLTKLSFLFSSSASWITMVLDGSVLKPLYRLPNITDFRLYNAPMRLTSEAIHALVSSWKRMRHFWLTPSVGSRPFSNFQLEDLEVLARKWPDLETLGVLVHAVDAQWSCPLGTYTQSSPLSTLQLFTSTISPRAVTAAATYLALVFPRAQVEHRFCSGWSTFDDEQEDADAAVIQEINNLKFEIAGGSTGETA